MAEQNKKQKSSLPLILIVGGLTLCLAVGYYVYTTYFDVAVTSGSVLEQAKQFPLKKIDWQKELFASEVFKSLTIDTPLQVTIDAGDTGNDSPFITTR